jgi:hypothetical protein
MAAHLPRKGMALVVLGAAEDLGPYLPRGTAYIRVTTRSWSCGSAPSPSTAASWRRGPRDVWSLAEEDPDCHPLDGSFLSAPAVGRRGKGREN